jgi:hypothetical protein
MRFCTCRVTPDVAACPFLHICCGARLTEPALETVYVWLTGFPVAPEAVVGNGHVASVTV